MTNVLVILTKNRVYTTLYKTIHFSAKRENLEGPDEQLAKAQALAFSLACTTWGAYCATVHLQDAKTDDDIFAYLQKRHATEEAA